jgi:prepilin-type N-terminal cleavage/methylation domain-containing protein
MTRSLFIKTRPAIRSQKGFTLVELIVTLVLVGIIGTFTTLFMYTGLNGYLRAKDTSEGALKETLTILLLSIRIRILTLPARHYLLLEEYDMIQATEKSCSASPGMSIYWWMMSKLSL